IYFNWIQNILQVWQDVLAEDGDEANDLLLEFRSAYDDLRRTLVESPPFEQVTARLSRDLRNVQMAEVNTRVTTTTPDIPWNRAYAWILVGGTALDRGFTVKGTTVTYMPRGPGIANADTVQQRGRFFGYKEGYLGLCRVYLESQTLAAFR